MSDDRVPAPLEALVRAIAGGSDDDDDQRATTFARGLALGALVGAAIAGSTIWQRRHLRAGRRAAQVQPAAEVQSGADVQSATEPAANVGVPDAVLERPGGPEPDAVLERRGGPEPDAANPS